MKWCDDIKCPNFSTELGSDTDCKLGFNNPLVLPKSVADTYHHNWGYRMPKVCRDKFKVLVPNQR